jgi:uncharacterized protein
MRTSYRLLMVVVWLLTGDNSQAASFNCDKAASATEKAVCADPALDRLDETMASRYQALLTRLPPVQADALRQEQRKWLQQRNRCGGKGDCLRREYQGRLIRLEQLAAPAPTGTAPPGGPPAPAAKGTASDRLPTVVYDRQRRQWLDQGNVCQHCTPRNGFPNPPPLRQGFYFHPGEGKWYDDYGPCHTCTPENGFSSSP